MIFLHKSLSCFNLVSFNLSGVTQDNLQPLLHYLKLETNFSVFALQEFSSHMEFQRIPCKIADVLVFPDISKHSKSNAIAISYELTPPHHT